MKSSIQSKSLLGLLAFLGKAVAIDYSGPYFVLHNSNPLVTERLDPVMSPGSNPSNHVHNIFGANTFGPTFDYDAAQKASCNTNGAKIDHSNYWYPALYFSDKAKGTYTLVPTDLTTYYHFDPINGKGRQAFPKGFKMISGNAMLRHNDTATNPATHSIRWYCHGPEVVTLGGFGEGFTNCNGVFGLSSEIWFPFCHDGAEFDPANPMAHMAFGQGSDGTPTQQGGDCPSTHPTALPQIFAEFHHDTSKFTWTADEQPFVLAQGDPLGFGMHADFVNGWEDGLQTAINVGSDGKTTNCHVGESGQASACFEQLPDSVVAGCTIDSVVQGDGDITNPGSALPGCNPLQTGPADATIQTSCAGYKAPTVQTGAAGASGAAVSSAVVGSASGATVGGSSASSAVVGNASGATVGGSSAGPTATSSPTMGSNSPVASAPSAGASATSTVASTNSTGTGSEPIPSSVEITGTEWIYQGCWSDLTDSGHSVRTLENWGNGADAQDCAISCAGAQYDIAGVEYGGQCFCGNKLNMSVAKKLDDTMCNMPCAGADSSQSCGGNGALQVYAAKGVQLTKRAEQVSHVHRHIRDFSR